jgi:hypothetical protein
MAPDGCVVGISHSGAHELRCHHDIVGPGESVSWTFQPFTAELFLPSAVMGRVTPRANESLLSNNVSGPSRRGRRANRGRRPKASIRRSLTPW